MKNLPENIPGRFPLKVISFTNLGQCPYTISSSDDLDHIDVLHYIISEAPMHLPGTDSQAAIARITCDLAVIPAA